MHAAIPKVSRVLYDSAESHRPIANALEEGRGREAGLLLRNHVETILEYLKRSESDSGIQRTFRRDLEDAKEVQLWGQQSLEAVLKSCGRKSPKEILNAILERVFAFANGQPQRDDETLLVMRGAPQGLALRGDKLAAGLWLNNGLLVRPRPERRNQV
jgi:hypothetical protein